MNITHEERTPLAVITGAAKRVGRSIALELASMNYAIGIHYHTSSDAAFELASQLTTNGVDTILLKADLTHPSTIEKMFDEISLSNHPFKILVNSASVMTRGNIKETSIAQWDHMMNLNLRATWLCIQHASHIMKEGGNIINISDSGAGHLWTNYAAYSISKAGLDVLTRMAAKSLAPAIRVNAIAPGLILRSENMEEVDWDALVGKLPLKKSGTPEDISRAVRYLLQNEHITGHTLVIDGGYQLISR
jgi:pteridine reductase